MKQIFNSYRNSCNYAKGVPWSDAPGADKNISTLTRYSEGTTPGGSGPWHNGKVWILGLWNVISSILRVLSLISKIGLDRASIVDKLRPTAAILELRPEEYSACVTEKKMRTLTFFYLKLANEMSSLDINCQSFPLSFCDTTEISNMAAVENNKIILWSPQNSLMIFTFEVV